MGEKQALSEAQVWDDSALQAIWNASVKEYQKYHSINARGENVAEVLKAAAEAEATVGAETMPRNGDGTVNGDGDGGSDEMQDADDGLNGEADEEGDYVPPDPDAETRTEQINGLPMPQAMIAQSTHDEKLKNLMMSWYWAGYYTGFYEGQQSQAGPTTNGA